MSAKFDALACHFVTEDETCVYYPGRGFRFPDDRDCVACQNTGLMPIAFTELER
jgi:hypothetical protein